MQPSAFGQYFDTPGFVNKFSIKTSGQVFEVKVVSNFDIPDYQFNKDEKRLSFIISSSVSNNLAEFEIPKNLIAGKFTFYLNGEEISPDVKTNELISFITLKFPGKGLHKFDMIGTTYLSETNGNEKTLDTSSINQYYEFEFYVPIIIASIVIAAGSIGYVFYKKSKKKDHSLTKD